ncbi:heterodisulfide reductase-related iron-sulfur binding cluster [Gordonia jinhuaensis]|uniref:Fe-S oxidoreductase n=1 Tax=Gordonia jinhuaensis TaxID=1517702 RepID=A0A916TET1_9ACTN|nr:(Fe-S)-binding protein [Gordonia jinhuaensis]GGB42291.1 putative Fe-S oxidoreductase [Gordonia jinhuaensis]
MNATTITIGTIAAVMSVFCWLLFLRGVGTMIRDIAQGQKVDSSRFWPFFPRLWTMLKEFVAHTRMVKFRTVGWAHWLVMFGFLIGAIFWFEAYGQIFDPDFHWPVIGAWKIYIFADEVLGLGTVIGILVLMTIRQLNHPRVPERLSRFSGSRFSAAYFVEWVVLLEGLGMVFVKTFKISSGLENPPIWTSFFTHYFAQLFTGSSEYWVTGAAVIKLMSGMVWLAVVGSNINWGVAWHRFAAFFNIYFKRDPKGGVALGAAKPMMSNGVVLDMETADPDVDAFGAGKVEDFTWKGWLDFTTCTECGRCQSQCPAWNTGKPLSPKLLIMSLRDHAQAKAPYLIAGGRKDMGGDEVGLVDADGNVDEAKLAKIPESARAEADRSLVGASAGTGEIDGELGAVIDTETLWSCTTCGACVEQCPVDIEHVDHIIDMRRYQVLIESEFPTELAGMFKNLENKGNPWGQNASARTNWIDEMDIEIPVFGQDVETFEGFEYLFWVGCAGAYEDRAKKTTKAVAELLDIAAVNFMVLGEGETCTGDSARRAGNEFLFQMLAQQNIETINEVFATAPAARKKVVVTCAHCFNTLSNEYPQLGAKYEVVHHTQLLNRLVRDKRLIPVAPVGGETVTYHDPCYLGRHNKVYDAPRELMAAAGSNLNEMPRHASRSMCCGAGGARMWMEEKIGKRINIDRVDEALSTLESSPAGETTQKVATGCPFCRVMLTDGVTAQTSGTENEGKVEVVDVAQLLLESVKRGAPEVTRTGRNLGPQSLHLSAPSSGGDAATATAVADATATVASAPTESRPEPASSSSAAAAPAKPAAKGFGMAGAKRPGGAKSPSAAAPAAETTAPETTAEPKAAEPKAPEPKAKGFGMGGAKRPGGAKKPGTAAATASTPAAESAPADSVATGTTAPETAAPEPKAKGFGMGGAKRPGAAKKPSAAAAPATEPAAAESASATTPAAESTAAETTATETAAPEPKAPEPKAKGFGMGAAKRPGAAAKKPAAATTAPAAETAEATAPEATPAPEATVTEAPSAPEATAPEPKAPEPKAKGFGMGSAKRPGAVGKAASAPAAAPAAPAEAPAAAAPAPKESAPEESAPEPKASAASVASEESTPTPASDRTDDARTITETTASKAKGFGIAAGKKRPGQR